MMAKERIENRVTKEREGKEKRKKSRKYGGNRNGKEEKGEETRRGQEEVNGTEVTWWIGGRGREGGEGEGRGRRGIGMKETWRPIIAPNQSMQTAAIHLGDSTLKYTTNF